MDPRVILDETSYRKRLSFPRLKSWSSDRVADWSHCIFT